MLLSFNFIEGGWFKSKSSSSFGLRSRMSLDKYMHRLSPPIQLIHECLYCNRACYKMQCTKSPQKSVPSFVLLLVHKLVWCALLYLKYPHQNTGHEKFCWERVQTPSGTTTSLRNTNVPGEVLREVSEAGNSLPILLPSIPGFHSQATRSNSQIISSSYMFPTWDKDTRTQCHGNPISHTSTLVL